MFSNGMFSNVWRRGRLAAAIGVCAAGVIAAAGVTASAASAGAAVAQSQSRVPWTAVGPGWELVQYTNATATRNAPTTLYLVSPAGTRYSMYTWRSPVSSLSLVDWSGDKTRALFYGTSSGQMEQLNLLTGRLSRFTLAGQGVVYTVGYTRPQGLNILSVGANGSRATLARYSLTGKLLKVLATNNYSITGVESADGSTLAVTGTKGLRLVSNVGGVIRQLPVPGTDPKMGCWPVRWWNAGTILSGCFGKRYTIARLWLVPASGAKPVALTPQRTPPVRDYGDTDAWRLNSGLYLQSLGACGTLELNKQNANGSIIPVKVPGTLNVSTRIITAQGPRLLVQALTGCGGSTSLLWFNPGTRAEQWLFKTPARASGVVAVVPYYTRENAPAL
jgi:hypothetical protein